MQFKQLLLFGSSFRFWFEFNLCDPITLTRRSGPRLCIFASTAVQYFLGCRCIGLDVNLETRCDTILFWRIYPHIIVLVTIGGSIPIHLRICRSHWTGRRIGMGISTGWISGHARRTSHLRGRSTVRRTVGWHHVRRIGWISTVGRITPIVGRISTIWWIHVMAIHGHVSRGTIGRHGRSTRWRARGIGRRCTRLFRRRNIFLLLFAIIAVLLGVTTSGAFMFLLLLGSLVSIFLVVFILFFFTFLHLFIGSSSIVVHFFIGWSRVTVVIVVSLSLTVTLGFTFVFLLTVGISISINIGLCISIGTRIGFLILIFGGIRIFRGNFFFFCLYIHFCLIIVMRCLFPFRPARTGICHDAVTLSSLVWNKGSISWHGTNCKIIVGCQ
mmetsp:Transcript_63198/g.183144  ORF Transcript_63198/g.183144 Transcript_63198/m.183144 type:complete len:384 (-) Transcript_63198:74-1225(-)